MEGGEAGWTDGWSDWVIGAMGDRWRRLTDGKRRRDDGRWEGGTVMKLDGKQACVCVCVCVCVCIPVGPVRLRGLVLGGGRQGGSVLMCVRVRVRVCVGGRVGGAGGALRGGVVGIGGRGAAVVEAVELIYLLICRLWAEADRERERQADPFSENVTSSRLSDSPSVFLGAFKCPRRVWRDRPVFDHVCYLLCHNTRDFAWVGRRLRIRSDNPTHTDSSFVNSSLVSEWFTRTSPKYDRARLISVWIQNLSSIKHAEWSCV